MTQYCVEHFSAELPSVAAFGPLLVAMTLGMAPYIYYRALKATEGPKALIWAAIAMFPVMLGVFKGLELGFPKDTPEEQAVANLDRTHRPSTCIANLRRDSSPEVGARQDGLGVLEGLHFVCPG